MTTTIKTKAVTKAEKLKRRWAVIGRKERLFQKMSPAQKRVAIAKDVLAQIKSGKIIPQIGNWIRLLPISITYDDLDDQLRDVMVTNETHCSACAVGALFVSTVYFKDKITTGEADVTRGSDWNAIADYLKDLFPIVDLALMEYAFEMGNSASGYCPVESEAIAFGNAEAFGRAIGSNTMRMIAIMKNLIANKGRFVPPPRYR
jgi:hypothetical protein